MSTSSSHSSDPGDCTEKDLRLIWTLNQESKKVVIDFNNCFHVFMETTKSGHSFAESSFFAGESLFGKPYKWNFSLTKIQERRPPCVTFLCGDVSLDPEFARGHDKAVEIMGKMTMTFKSGGNVSEVNESRITSMVPAREEDASGITSYIIFYDELLGLSPTLKKLRLIVDLTIYAGVPKCSIPKKRGPKVTGVFTQELLEDLGTALESGRGSDVVMKVPYKNGRGYYCKEAHKSILVTRSPVFERMFSPDNGMLEGRNGEVVIEDMAPDCLDVFLKFLYTGEISSNWTEVVVDLINASEKYEIPRLKNFCDDKLVSCCDENNVAEVYKLAKKFGLSKALKDIEQFAAHNVKLLLEKM